MVVEDRRFGASTIAKQLVENLFFGAGRSILRKGAEFTLVPAAEFVLGKQCILQLYLNVVAWGPEFTVQGRRVTITTKSQRGISTSHRQHGSPLFCRLL